MSFFDWLDAVDWIGKRILVGWVVVMAIFAFRDFGLTLFVVFGWIIAVPVVVFCIGYTVLRFWARLTTR